MEHPMNKDICIIVQANQRVNAGAELSAILGVNSLTEFKRALS